MNKAESDRIHELCSSIAVEQHHKKFTALVEELNRVLSTQNHRLQDHDKNNDQNKNEEADIQESK
jgi:hypothetical protein